MQLTAVQEAEDMESKYSKKLGEQVGRLQVSNKSEGKGDMSEVGRVRHAAPTSIG